MISDSRVRVSVVINTCNRGAYIADTLVGLSQQTYDNFEVIVVNGPSIDNTEEIVKRFNVRYFDAPYNISVSRNIGIKYAAGDIIAFIDDDAVPEPDWLKDIVKAYDDPVVGAAGGRVYNADGSDFQYCYGKIDVWGYPISGKKMFKHNTPGAYWYNINIGTNASYRRDALIKIGGFDEEIEYYHDESDVCVRLIDNGYHVAQLEGAYVHHKMAPSFRRKDSKRIVVWDSVIKNTIYFGIKHSKGKKSLWKRLVRPAWCERHKLNAPWSLMRQGEFSFIQTAIRYASLIRAFFRGYVRGFFQERKLLKDYKYMPEDFKQYKKDNSSVPLHIVLVNQGYPPDQSDGNARHNGALAKELVSRGHKISVVARAEDNKPSTVTYVDGVWLYRHQPKTFVKQVTGFARVDSQIAHAKSVYRTVSLIKDKMDIDVILTPVWDVEGTAILRHKIAPTILSLMSPLKKVVETQWFNAGDPSYEITYELERYNILNADAVMSISNNVKDTISELYNIDWQSLQSKVPVRTIPLGVDAQFEKRDHYEKGNKALTTVLYTGRFERRKGIDLLLKIIPEILQKYDKVEFQLVGGDPSAVDENGKSYFQEFEKRHKGKKWFGRLKQVGYVSEEELVERYANCDIFVAPSRYESFGQIYIEAMAVGKPVIGTRVGGIPEVVQDGVNGILVENENLEELRDAIEELLVNRKKRLAMGKASKVIIAERFSSKVWGDSFLSLVDEVINAGKTL